jgi:hypothetical protein
MGYRSEVRSVIYGPPDKVQAFWTKHTLLENPAIKGFESDIRRYMVDSGDGTAVIDLRGDSWKWYPDYPDVAGWLAMIDEIGCEAEGTEGLSYEFARLGEESDDTEYHTGGHDPLYWLSFRREILDDMPHTLKDESNEQDAESQG